MKTGRCLLLLIFVVNSFAAPGDFDPTFGYGGAVQLGTPYNFLFADPATWEPPRCCVLSQQADGKLLVAGATDAASPRLILRRFNTNGTVDTSYGLGGEAIATGPYPAEFVYGVPLALKSLSNGKTLVTGFVMSGGKETFMVWRFTGTGILDPTFGSDGRITRSAPSDNAGLSITEYRNSIYAAGRDNRIYCMNDNGSACLGFGGLPGYKTVVGTYRVEIQPVTNKLVAAGYGWIKRYSLNGQLDSSFGQGGTASACSPDCGSECSGMTVEMAVYPNGRMVVLATTGLRSYSYSQFFTIALHSLGGQPDPTFDGNGCAGDEALSAPPSAFYGAARGLEIEAGGSIIVLEGHPHSQYPSNYDNWGVRRFLTDGSFDLNFSAAGTLDRNQDVLVQPDGKIVTLGSHYYSSTNTLEDIYISRYFP